MKRKKKKISVLRLILLIIGIILLTAVILVIALGASLLIRFHNSAYEYEPPVEREDEYIMPDYPEVIIDPNAQWMADDTQQETLPPETVPVTVPDTAPETVPETVPETAESVPETAEPEEIVPETEEPAERAETAEVEETENDGLTEQVPNSDPDETQKPETQAPAETPKASQTVYVPPETLPNVVNPAPATSAPETKPAETIAYNRDASFSNSANTVSVYAGVPIYKVNQTLYSSGFAYTGRYGA